jgi:hypothetical protein
MHDAERFSALIGDIYDAALDPLGLAHGARPRPPGSSAARRQRSIPRTLPTKPRPSPTCTAWTLDTRNFIATNTSSSTRRRPATTFRRSGFRSPLVISFAMMNFSKRAFTGSGCKAWRTACMPYWTSRRRALMCSAYPVMSLAVATTKHVDACGSSSPIFDAPC